MNESVLERVKVSKAKGIAVKFDGEKIFRAICLAARSNPKEMTEENCRKVADAVIGRIAKEAEGTEDYVVSVDYLHVLCIKYLKEMGYEKTSKEYSEYRKEIVRKRGLHHAVIEAADKIAEETTRGNDGNANVGNNFSSKLLGMASNTNKWRILAKMPKELSKLHENGDLYYHDLDSYDLTTNCLHLDTGKVFERGFNTGYGFLRTPKRIESAAEQCCLLLQSSQNDMFGGQAHVNFDNDLSTYVEVTRKKIADKVNKYFWFRSRKWRARVIEEELMERVHQSMQAIVYNLNTMHSRAGSQVPFSSVNIGLPNSKDAALICQVFLEEYDKGLGKGEQPIWPNIIFRVKAGVNRDPGDPYYYLFKLATKVSAHRMNPTFMNIDASFNKAYYDKGIYPALMGCRTYICSNVNAGVYGGAEGPNRRGNGAPVTIILPRIGIMANKDIDKFFAILDERLNLAVISLQHRYDTLKKRKGKDMPFVIGQNLLMGSEYVGPEDSIEPVLLHMSWAIGFIGVAETVYALLGKYHNESEEAKDLAYRIVKHIRDFCDGMTKALHLNFSCYATPAEGLSGKALEQDRKKFGIIEGVTDKEFYTNSFHVPVNQKIGIKEKLEIEAPFHNLCNGGHISYIEFDSNPSPETIERVIRNAFKTTNIGYIGINFHISYCRDCGTQILDDTHVCPHCASTNIQGISRVTGYLSLDERFTYGKQHERSNRRSHNDETHDFSYRK